MKNKTFFAIVGALVIIGGAVGIYQYSASTASANLSVEEAQTKAQQQFPGDVVEIELDEKGNNAVYEIEIEGNKYSYELKLDATNGEIVHLEEKELKNTNRTANNTTENNSDDKVNSNDADQGVNEKDDTDDGNDTTIKDTNQKETKNTLISKEKAKELAFAQVEEEGRIEELELDDDDDGYLYYEIELVTKKNEVEMEIDAYTGEIIALSIDNHDD